MSKVLFTTEFFLFSDDDSSEKGEETEGTDAESEDLEGEAEPQDGEEQGEEDAKEGGSKEVRTLMNNCFAFLKNEKIAPLFQAIS